MKEKFVWWKHGVIYHIYPRSFYDSNNDGIGDLPGITQKLDYLADLGITALWLSPVYESPQHDFGYDVSDYRSIDRIFGSFEDFKTLLAEAHKRNIYIIMDLIMNHTSDQHPWFLESKTAKDNPKRDWYIWKEGSKKKRPNNWKTAFGKTAWEYDPQTDEYYYHSFFKEQPDLNWRHPEVKIAFFDEIKFWLDQGVDGFRLDVINFIAKDKKFRNNPSFTKQFNKSAKVYTRNRPKSLKIIKSLRKLLDSYDDKMCVGEIYTLPPGDSELCATYLGNGKNGLHMAFDFSLIFTRWSAKKYAKTLQQNYSVIPKDGWPCNVLSNHDLHRSFSNALFSHNAIAKAKLKAFLLFTLPGTPFIYYGEEIAMQNTSISRKNIMDKLGKMYWPFYSGRDKARTPMQWTDETFAGFSAAKPWLPVNSNYRKFNVHNQLHDNNSVLNTFKRLIRLRNSKAILQKGKWELIENIHSKVLAYKRSYKGEWLYVFLNFANHQVVIPNFSAFLILDSTHAKTGEISGNILLAPFEGIIMETKN